MRIVIAPDKFKDALDAMGIARAMADGARLVDPDATLDLCPMADGGEGTVRALVAANAGRIVTRRVTGPLPDTTVEADIGLIHDGRTAIIEMASASGLALLSPSQRNPARTTSFGTGQLLVHAQELGARQVILGIGGSATIDLGIGCAQACGLPVLLADGEPLCETDPLTGADLERVVLVKHGRGSKVDRLQITVASDVTNPLCGPRGAAAVYGPQKGATPQQIEWFDHRLRDIARRTGCPELMDAPGAGAAGGMGFATLAFFGAQMRPGFDVVADHARLRERLRGADLCITGEGCIGADSHEGKVVGGVARLCAEAHVPCVALAGTILDGVTEGLMEMGLTAVLPILDRPMDLPTALQQTPRLIRQATATLLRLRR